MIMIIMVIIRILFWGQRYLKLKEDNNDIVSQFDDDHHYDDDDADDDDHNDPNLGEKALDQRPEGVNNDIVGHVDDDDGC